MARVPRHGLQSTLILSPDLKGTISLHHITVFCDNLVDLGMARALANVLDESLDDVVISLSFALDRIVYGVAAPPCDAIFVSLLSRKVAEAHALRTG